VRPFLSCKFTLIPVVIIKETNPQDTNTHGFVKTFENTIPKQYRTGEIIYAVDSSNYVCTFGCETRSLNL